MSLSEDVRNSILQWDAVFPLDRAYRKQHGISLFSEEHLKLCQYSIYLEFLEDQMFEEFIKEGLEQREREEQFKEGKIIKEVKIDKKEENRLFELLRKSKFNNIKVGENE